MPGTWRADPGLCDLADPAGLSPPPGLYTALAFTPRTVTKPLKLPWSPWNAVLLAGAEWAGLLGERGWASGWKGHPPGDKMGNGCSDAHRDL